MLRKLLIAGLLAALLAAPASAKPRELMPGVTYDRLIEFTPNGPVAVHVLVGPRPGGLWGLKAVLSNESILGREQVTEIERRYSASSTTAGVNGDLFAVGDGHPSGMLMRGGVLDHAPLARRSSLGIDSQGTLRVARVALLGTWQGSGQRRAISGVNQPAGKNGVSLFTPAWGPSTPPVLGSVEVVLAPFPPATPNAELSGPVAQVAENGGVAIPPGGAVLSARGTAAVKLAAEALVGQTVKLRLILKPDWSGVVDALGGGPVLVKDGRAVFRSNEDFAPSQLLQRGARTAAGQLADGRVLLVAVDGGQAGYSAGMSNFELALLMVRLGAATAAALDGGGSATMAFDGELLNQPSDRTGERAVAEALLFTYAGVYALPPLEPVLSPDGDGIAERQRLAYKIVRPSTVDANLVGPDGLARYTFSGPVAPGTYPLDWPGTREDGSPELEGRWSWTVQAVDDLGQSSSVERVFALNRTLGFPRPVPPALAVPRAKPRAVAAFELTRAATVTTRFETASGVVLKTLEAELLGPGEVQVAWDGRTDAGALVYSGRYVARAIAENELGAAELTATFAVRRIEPPKPKPKPEKPAPKPKLTKAPKPGRE